MACHLVSVFAIGLDSEIRYVVAAIASLVRAECFPFIDDRKGRFILELPEKHRIEEVLAQSSFQEILCQYLAFLVEFLLDRTRDLVVRSSRIFHESPVSVIVVFSDIGRRERLGVQSGNCRIRFLERSCHLYCLVIADLHGGTP